MAIWVQFAPYEEVEVETAGCSNVGAFIKAVQNELSCFLGHVHYSQLVLYTHDDEKLSRGRAVADLARISSSEKPLKITIILDATKQVKLSPLQGVDADRVSRWRQLNDILLQAEEDAMRKTDKKRSKGIFPYSAVGWELIAPVYADIIQKYVQPRKEVPESTLNDLHGYLRSLTRRLGSVTHGNESYLLHFIAPILVYVTDLFDDTVQILIEKDLNGQNVKAHGHFEFIIKRGRKRICIVEAKKDNMEQGLTQDLLGGMEVAADLDRLNTVYGIVTNYVEWIFLTSTPTIIQKNMDVLNFGEEEVVTKDSLSRIAGKIYSLLSD